MEHHAVDYRDNRGLPMSGARRDGRLGGRVSRRSFLRTAALGSGAALALGCQPSATPAGQPSAGSGSATSGVAPAGSAATGGWEARWNALVDAAKAEGALVI